MTLSDTVPASGPLRKHLGRPPKQLESMVLLMARTAALLAAFFVLGVTASDAGQAPAPSASAAVGAATSALTLPPDYGGPPPPDLPQTIARSSSGQVTLRAVRLTSPIDLDGRLDEPVYSEIMPASGFTQTEPVQGRPASDDTDVWILFDADNLYVTARMWESEPARMVANEMRHDNTNIMQNENFTFFIDTFNDRRNGFVFIVNPIGAKTEAQTTNGQYSRDWYAIWDVELGRFDGGWTAEIVVPFKSLRYSPGQPQVWGFNARRVQRWRNELTHLTQVPNSLGLTGVFQAAFAGTVVGIEAPSGSRNLELKPYAISDLLTDRRAVPQVTNALDGDVGLDVKYGITQSLTLDLTYNTDFAQVEADEQQVNLTRFSLFFPEKRDFFLENAGLFVFGGGSGFGPRGDMPILFYSRRIGLSQGREVPIEGGGRLTGRVGRYTLGLVNIQTGDEPVSGARSTNFSVIRLRRDVLRRSSIGLIATERSVRAAGAGTNGAYGIDGTFTFFENLDINAYWARTRTAGLAGKDTSYRAQLDYGGDRYGLMLERLVVGDAFNPEVGFVQRDDIRRTSGRVRFSPRPSAIASVRRFSWTGSVNYVENGVGHLETRNITGEFSTEFQTSDFLRLSYTNGYEFLPRPFRIAPNVTLPVGGYNSSLVNAGFTFAQQRAVSGRLSVEHGSFFGGDRTVVGLATGRVQVVPQVAVEPRLSINWVTLPEGSFTTKLLGSRVVYTMTPRIFTTALVQYSSSARALSANVRLRWEYRPGSEFFLVYNEQRDTLARGFPNIANRVVIVKINRLLRF